MGKLSQEGVRRLTADSQLASQFLMDRKWGVDRGGFTCLRCGEKGIPWASKEHSARCRHCRTIASPLSGTILGKTKVSPSEIIWMTWALASRPSGLSAVEVSRESTISRVTAQRVLGLLRKALTDDERERVLIGSVEADETFLGGHGRDTNKRGRSEPKKCVLVIVEEGKGGKCVVRYTSDAKAATLLPVIKDSVEPGAQISTDGHRAYNGLEKMGYDHSQHVIQGSGIRAHVMLPAVHQVAKTLKAQIYGTHKRTPKDELLQDYLGAFQWRYNRRSLEPVDAFSQAINVLLHGESDA